MNNHNISSARYEKIAVILLALTFGLVGLDRWIVAPLFPAMMGDLDLDYQDLGNIIGALGLAWGASSIFIGGVSDKLGRRKVLIVTTVLFSLCSLLTGLAGGLVSLILIRIIMGVTEGAFGPTAVAATADASHPKRRGLNMGIQQSTFALFGIGLGPIIATQLVEVMPSWRSVFYLSVVPGLILSLLMYFYIKDPSSLEKSAPSVDEAEANSGRWLDLFKIRNIQLSIIALCGVMSCIFVLSAMIPSYFSSTFNFDMSAIGLTASGIGFGAFFGQLCIPGVSDKIGRKLSVIMSLGISIILTVFFIFQGPNFAVLFCLLFFVAFGANGCLALLAGTIAVESVPRHLMAGSVGTVIGIGEMFGGGVAPSIAGYLAQNYGVEYSLYLALGGLVLSLLASSFLKETSPRMGGE